MQKTFDAHVDPAAGNLVLTGELRPEGHAPLIPHKTPFQLMKYKIVQTDEGSIRFTFNVAFIGVNFERELMAEKGRIEK